MIRFTISFIICISFSVLKAQVLEQELDTVVHQQVTKYQDSIKSIGAEQISIIDENAIRIKVDSVHENLPQAFELDQQKEHFDINHRGRLNGDSLISGSDLLVDSLVAVNNRAEDLLSEKRTHQEMKFNKISDSLMNQKTAFDKAFDVDKIIEKYDQEMLNELPPLNSSVIKEKKIPLLDSMRAQYLKYEKLKFKEKEITDEYKNAALKKKESFFKRSFFDGIMGINEDFKVFNISPAYGLQITERFSSGLGINMGINLEKPSENILVGLRSFLRYELLKKKLYAQLEDNSYWPGISYPNWEREMKEANVKHSISVGGGYMIQFANNKSLNLAFLYQLNNKSLTSDFNAPVVMRLGISMFNK